MPKKRIADMNRSERIRYKELEQQRERRYRRLISHQEARALETRNLEVSLHPVPSLQTPTDTGYLDYREGLKLQKLMESIG
jgi:hypothetical protein